MEVPKDIAEAREYLDQGDREINLESKVKKLTKGIDLLKLYAKETLNIPEDIATHIRNLRRAHARSLLSQLPSIKEIGIDIWIKYMDLFVFKLKEEVDYVTKEDPELISNYNEFLDIWLDAIKEVLKERPK